MQNRTGNRGHRKTGDKAWQSEQGVKMAVMRDSVAPAAPGDGLRQYHGPDEAVQLRSTAFAGGTN